jgi:maltose alpha-D-glucosyltransferase/alpha-amylase
MRYEWRNNAVLFLHHLSDQPCELELEADQLGPEGALLVNLLSDEHSRADTRGRHCILLQAYGYRWYRIGGLQYLLKRSAV